MEGLLAEYDAQPREIIIERIQGAIPIASAVDFQALQGSEPAVRRDQFSGLDFHWPPVLRFRGYSIGTRERLHDRRHHSRCSSRSVISLPSRERECTFRP